ncbi:hypothetical protein J2W42_006732 [Rhizobium tibeticum]|uniref:Uncharacterized protein n=1 Tax=Rhizobium tibeticum TaxID=501024 RepID=A0A1H8VD21_9HYPH|nr:hypothetical protein [Rhizobium tibeticum]MDP9813856.1 hypothetical protein [Rhizobium tibeticum]SEI18673.1 hypothetical protein RTCCBAU85039_5964 [Rhizobium tibeticum]SEP13380.1 hypothetical protein SAMN05216228_104146 [Rhizobium tibeticum]
MAEQAHPNRFAPRDHCCYMRKATIDGRLGWVLIDSDGYIVLFTENRSEVFFEAFMRELTLVWRH